ncbi:MAG: DNA-processing protein DprA [Thermoleophilia bacterium]
MSDRYEAAALVALLRRGGRIWHLVSDEIEERGSAIAILDETSLSADLTLFPAQTDQRIEEDLDAVVAEIGEWEAEGIRLVTVLDDDYPQNLRAIHNRPPLLFLRGSLLAGDARAIAVVGTRQVSPDGLRQATAMAEDLSAHGFTIVSGLAAGVDTAAHRAALDSGRRTVAVIGTGIRRSYPAVNAELQERIAAEGAVVSQFWPDAPPRRQSFPMRNIVMSGIALATVVIEASHTSGARMQARIALEHGRPVFLMRSLLSHDWARAYAERPGTHVVGSAIEVAEHVERLTSLDALSA